MNSQHDSRTRRRLLRRSAVALAGTFLAGCAGSLGEDDDDDADGTTTSTRTETVDPGRTTLRKLGQTRPAAQPPPGGGYAETAVRADGEYAVLGTKWGTDGTHLIDLADPASPKAVHYLKSSNDAPNIDVKFDHRDGLYYRTIEKTWPGNFEVVDYGYSTGTPTTPRVVGTVSEGKSHNVTPHPGKPVLYTVNYGLETNGFDVYDVADPTAPRKVGQYGPQGACHDITVDPEREVLCVAFQAGQFIGFVVYDVSDPRNPSEIGRFDYGSRKSYEQAPVGAEAFGSAHHGHFDPRRDLLVLGDERPFGAPGGKHVFDVGWRDGSLENPVPVGFTVSPNARRMEEGKRTERFDWTGHHFNVVPWGDATLLVSADWHDGVVVYDVTDPTAPHPVDRYPTADGADAVTPNDSVAALGTPPMAWKASYNRERELVVASDAFTGLYTFELAPRPG